MSVVVELSPGIGDLTIDLFVDQAPKACENFLKLCKIKYYNYAPIHTIRPTFLQTGDPLGPRSSSTDNGSSIWGLLPSASTSARLFEPEFNHSLKRKRGTVSMATAPATEGSDTRLAGSQFIITLRDDPDYRDGEAAIFGEVVESDETLDKLSKAFVDNDGYPLKDIRIRHTHILEEADIPDPPSLIIPPESPLPSAAQLATVRIPDDEEIDENADPETVDKLRREREARAQALTLEMVGDLPFADVKPPENVLFVCKLNPVTQDSDLELIFGRFGNILSCEVIRDKRTGDSLQYAFIEFENKRDCEQAYAKMDQVLIDDCRIHVDFSQSVSKLGDWWREKQAKNRNRGGFGGFENLEKRRQYRVMDGKENGKEYDLVVEQQNGRGQTNRDGRRRSRSPKRRRSYSRERHRRDDNRDRRDRRDYYRDRSRSRERERDDRRRDDRKRGDYRDDRVHSGRRH